MGKPIYESLVKTGRVVRGYLGIGIQEITPDLATTFHLPYASGALVTDVKPGSPASQAGLVRGDAIITYQGKPIADPRGLQQVVTRTPVHADITLTIIRDGTEQEIRTTIGEHPDSIQITQDTTSSTESELAGVAVEDLSPRMAQQLGVSPDIAGVVVTSVQPGSHADQAGISRGDVISEINRNPVHSRAEYDHIVSALSKEKRALLLVYRKGVPLFLSVKV
jgi:serine protease Do